jgi:hypothetical protein
MEYMQEKQQEVSSSAAGSPPAAIFVVSWMQEMQQQNTVYPIRFQNVHAITEPMIIALTILNHIAWTAKTRVRRRRETRIGNT